MHIQEPAQAFASLLPVLLERCGQPRCLCLIRRMRTPFLCRFDRCAHAYTLRRETQRAGISLPRKCSPDLGSLAYADGQQAMSAGCVCHLLVPQEVTRTARAPRRSQRLWHMIIFARTLPGVSHSPEPISPAQLPGPGLRLDPRSLWSPLSCQLFLRSAFPV
jgi:hypothetical protein